MANPSSKAFSLASYFFQTPPSTSEDRPAARSIAWQMEHRLELLSFWDIKAGSRVLELGCGQGDCTIPLADAVGETGHVHAVDPGAPDYGSPQTLSQSQSHLKTTSLGSRITFHLLTDPVDFLASVPSDPATPPYDYIVLAHCIWYFSSPSTLSSIVRACLSKTRYLCVAEWSLRASLPAAQPHVLAALLLLNLQTQRRTPTDGNIRCILSPRQIASAITSAHSDEEGPCFELERARTGVTNGGMLDGYWETSYALRSRRKALERLRAEGVTEKAIGGLIATFDALEASVDLLDAPEGKERVSGVRSMDFWVGRFKLVAS